MTRNFWRPAGASYPRNGPSRGKSKYLRMATVGSAIALAFPIAGCGSTSKAASTHSPTSGGSTSVGKQSGAGSTSSGSGTPILVGLDEPDRGAFNLGATMTPGIDGGVKYVNETLHGIDGHPVKLVTCNSDGTPSTEVNCANNFVSKGVVAVFDSFDPGFSAASPIIQRAGIPVFGVSVADLLDDRSSGAYFFGPPEEAFEVGPLQVFHEEGFNRVSLTISNLPSSVAAVKTGYMPVAKELGMDLHITYYDPSSVSWAVIANSLLTSNPQVTGMIAGPESDCNSLISALRGNGFTGPVLMGSCSAYVGQDPTGAVNTYSYSGVWLPSLKAAAPAAVQDQIGKYKAAMASDGNANVDALGQWAVNAFAGLVDFHDAMVAAHPSSYTTTTVRSALAAVTKYQSFMGPTDTCDHKEWPGTSSCNHSLLLVKVGANDVYQSAMPGGFAPLDPSLLPG